MVQIKIILINISKSISATEAELSRLVSQGWKIVAAGGNEPAGFVVLQKD